MNERNKIHGLTTYCLLDNHSSICTTGTDAPPWLRKMLPQSLERFLGAPVSPQTSLLCESERVTFLAQHPVPVPDVIILSASWGLTCRILYE